MIMNLNLTVPTCWQELNQKQLRYVYYLLAEGYSKEALQTHCLCRWSGLEILCPEGDGYSVRHNFARHHVTALQVAEVLSHLDWLLQLPFVPVRLSEIQGHAAARADLQGVSFEQYLILENLFQGYLVTKNLSLFDDTTEILYGTQLKLLPEEQVSIFDWLSSVKQMFARRWNHFFKPTGGEQHMNMEAHLQNLMDTQIRALTKGDITKEAEVLSMDVHRALTELNAQAKDYEELKKSAKS